MQEGEVGLGGLLRSFPTLVILLLCEKQLWIGWAKESQLAYI